MATYENVRLSLWTKGGVLEDESKTVTLDSLEINDTRTLISTKTGK